MRPLLQLLTLSMGCVLIQCNGNAGERTGTKIEVTDFNESFKENYFEGPDRIGIVAEAASEIEDIFARHADENHLPGLVYGVVVDDSLVCKGGTGVLNLEDFRAVSDASMFRIASMTKSFTAMAIVRLRDEGLISLSDPVARYVPEMDRLVYPTEDSPVITVENLLRMTAGFPEDNPWGDRQLDAENDELIQMIDRGISFSSPPATQYEYSNLGYAILGNIISSVTGMPYQDYITKNILLPLGMTRTVWDYSDVPEALLAQGYRREGFRWIKEPMLHDGAFGAMGGMITSVRDFSKYVSFLLSAWPPRNGPETGPVRRSSVREMQIPADPELYPEARHPGGEICALQYGYGYGLGIARWCNGERWVMHGGGLPGFGSHYVFFPDYGMGIISFCNLTYAAPSPANFRVKQMLFDRYDIRPRRMPVSDILQKRKQQLMELIHTWDENLEQEILAGNFYLDRSREDRINQISRVLESAGRIITIGEIEPENRLRGTFLIKGEKGEVSVHFTLTPENNPKVQALEVSYVTTDPR